MIELFSKSLLDAMGPASKVEPESSTPSSISLGQMGEGFREMMGVQLAETTMPPNTNPEDLKWLRKEFGIDKGGTTTPASTEPLYKDTVTSQDRRATDKPRPTTTPIPTEPDEEFKGGLFQDARTPK